MDDPSRQRARGIRTIGRLPVPQSDDILLAQWPLPADPGCKRQDVAISSEWRPVSRLRTAHHAAGRSSGDLTSADQLFDSYEHHQQQVIHRLLEAIDAELKHQEPLSLAYEPPAIPLEEVLSALDQAIKLGDLSSTSTDLLRIRALRLGETVARLWALVDLHRSGHITRDELRQKRDLVVGDQEISQD